MRRRKVDGGDGIRNWELGSSYTSCLYLPPFTFCLLPSTLHLLPLPMAVHIELGRKGERLAEDYLLEKGYAILHRNWRHAHLEIDLIAYREPVLHFIEVKLRSSKKVLPEKSVNKKKFRYLLKAADEFLYQHPQYRHIQFDIVAVTLGKEPELFFIEDVYL